MNNLNFLAAMMYVVARLKEPSSYAGLAGFLTALNVSNPGDMATTVMQVGMMAAGFIAMAIPEKKK